MAWCWQGVAAPSKAGQFRASLLIQNTESNRIDSIHKWQLKVKRHAMTSAYHTSLVALYGGTLLLGKQPHPVH